MSNVKSSLIGGEESVDMSSIHSSSPEIKPILKAEMNCCPSADFTFMVRGFETCEKNIQADEYTHRFIPFSAIENITYTHSRQDGGMIAIWVNKQCFRYTFPCSTGGKEVYDNIVKFL